MKANLYWPNIDSRHTSIFLPVYQSKQIANNLTEDEYISPTNSFSSTKFHYAMMLQGNKFLPNIDEPNDNLANK
jgi:hypothetical protein